MKIARVAPLLSRTGLSRNRIPRNRLRSTVPSFLTSHCVKILAFAFHRQENRSQALDSTWKSLVFVAAICGSVAIGAQTDTAASPQVRAAVVSNIRSHREAARPLLTARSFYPYFTTFVEQERSFLKDDPPPLDWSWFVHNIPLLDVPDKEIERTYYFRWYAFQKHIRQTPEGYIITEFLDDVPWAGKYDSIDAAASMQLREARWLRDPAYAEQYARFWFTPAGDPRRYSFPVADSVYSVYLTNGDRKFATGLLPDLIHNYGEWEKTHRDPNGLFWQIDDRDGMEYSIGGSGYRPTINSYMYGDAIAISKIAAMDHGPSLSQRYSAKAETLRNLIETRLWDPQAEFYETLPREANATWVGVRELVGFIPWYYNIPHADHDVAWKQSNSPEGFAGAYGPTTAERSSPRFRFAAEHECLWNGPSWPFATTQTLVAMANLLNGPPQSVIQPEDYFNLLASYAHSQRIRLADGSYIPWIDEDLDADTGEWIARDILQSRKQPPANRGRYYNHSGFADLIITGLLGVRPGPGNTLTIHPLLPANKWNYFAIDGVPYHGHLLSLFYDKTGEKYKRGIGLHLFMDQVEVASSPVLQPLTVHLSNDTSASHDMEGR